MAVRCLSHRADPSRQNGLGMPVARYPLYFVETVYGLFVFMGEYMSPKLANRRGCEERRDAFDKFRMWKKSQTALKLTVLAKGETPTVFTGEVVSVVEEMQVVGFLVAGRSALPCDFRGATFRIGKWKLEAEREGGSLCM